MRLLPTTLQLTYQAIGSGLIFGSRDIAGVGLDSSPTRRSNSHCSVLVQKSTAGATNDPKTVVVVAVVRGIVVTIRRTAIPRIVDPRTAAIG